MKKTLLALVFSLTLIVALAIFGASAASEGTPVSTAAEFEAMVSGGNYYLTNDIDFGGKKFITGYILAEFSGNIDGNGYSLLNFSLEVPDGSSESGVIAVYRGGVISNLNVGSKDAPISVALAGTPKASGGLGVLIGYSGKRYAAVVDTVNIYANMDLKADWKGNVAMVIAYSYTAIIKDTNTYGSIYVGSGTQYNDNYRNVGGFTASANADTIYENCANYANITLAPTGKEARVGGISAYAGSPSVFKNCANYGNLTVEGGDASDTYMGGLIADCLYGTTVVSVSWKNTGVMTGVKNTAPLAGRAKYGLVIVDGAEAQRSDVAYIEAGSFFYSEAIGAEGIEGATAVSNKEEFLAMQSGGVYYLTADIDLGGQEFVNGIFLTDCGGVVDGNGHKVTNFTIKGNDTNTSAGIFGVVPKSLIVTDITFGTEASPIIYKDLGTISMASSSVKSFGGVVGAGSSNMGVVLNGVDIYMNMNTNSVSKSNVAGLVGATKNSVIMDCNTYGSVTSGKADDKGTYYMNTAGFVGSMAGPVIIMDSVNNIDVTSGALSKEDASRAGGFVGWAQGGLILYNCTNTGDMKSTSDLGGSVAALVSQLHADCALNIYKCANTGTVAANTGEGCTSAAGVVLGRTLYDYVVILTDFTTTGNYELNGQIYPTSTGVPTFVVYSAMEQTPDTSDRINIVAIVTVALVSVIGSAVVLNSIRKRREFNV